MANTKRKLRFLVSQSEKTKQWSFVLYAGDEKICSSDKFSRVARCLKFVKRIKEEVHDATVEFD